MPTKYNMYVGISEEEMAQFELLWERHSAYLAPLPSMVHQSRDKYAAVFNTWIRYSKMKEPLIVKPNRTFIHGSVHAMSTKLKNYMPSIIREEIIDHLGDTDFMFIHSYYLTRHVMFHLEKYLQEKDSLNEYITYEYYFLEDLDVPEDSGINLLIKEIMYGFVHRYLTEKTIREIYYESMQETKSMIHQYYHR